jgi:hypothetical protein
VETENRLQRAICTVVMVHNFESLARADLKKLDFLSSASTPALR